MLDYRLWTVLNFLNITVLWLCKKISSFLKNTKVKGHEVYNLVSNGSENII